MKIKRSKIILAWVMFLVSSVLLQLGPNPTSWSNEFSIFNFKIAIVLLAIYICTTDDK